MKKAASNSFYVLFCIAGIITFFGFGKMITVFPQYIYNLIVGVSMPGWLHGIVIVYSLSLIFCIGVIGYYIWAIYYTMARHQRRTHLYEEKLSDMKQEANLDALMQRDKGFSKDKFVIRAKKMAISIMEAQGRHDIGTLRILLDDKLFEQFLEQINKIEAKQLEQIYERIFISKTKLTRYWEDSEYEYIKVIFVMNYRACIREKHTKKILQGNLNHKLVKKSEVVFMRKLGTQTNKDSDLFDSEYCPNCGASLDISVKGVCNYCQTTVSSGKFRWAIQSLEGEIIENMTFTIRG